MPRTVCGKPLRLAHVGPVLAPTGPLPDVALGLIPHLMREAQGSTRHNIREVIVSAFENAKEFFHACDSLKGWEGCKQYVAPNAPFSAQSEPLVDVSTVEEYTEWLVALGRTLEGCSYDLHTSSYDEASKAATFFATFIGRHVGEGGPVPPTNKETNTHYVYVLSMNDEGQIEKMCKIWNAPWALKELGWM